MNIYIDEAGAFVPPQGNRPHHYSLVLALIVPTETEAELFYQFLRLRDDWPSQAVEIKGSKLNEDQTAQVMKLLAAHDVIAEYHAIDMALHQSEVIDEFKARQAASLTENLTPAHSAGVVRRLHDDAQAIRTMANPLFVQAFLTIELILDMLDTAINYYAQRRPSELGRFAWMIDQKDRSLTQIEQLWSTLILPFGVSRSAKHPYAKVEGFDYSHFAKYEITESTADERMQRHLEWMRSALPFSMTAPDELHCIDAKRIWTEERAFADSKSNLGLQLADIAASTLCRALNDHLQLPGWESVSQILIRKKTAPFIQLGKTAKQYPVLEPHAAMVWRTLDAKSKAMVI
ncbi:MAG: DUF3800 domain-containing protein [Acidobacteria bacterium]|nr:DUF3800 domain-containing protein [Acidobacteriota bacterium]